MNDPNQRRLVHVAGRSIPAAAASSARSKASQRTSRHTARRRDPLPLILTTLVAVAMLSLLVLLLVVLVSKPLHLAKVRPALRTSSGSPRAPKPGSETFRSNTPTFHESPRVTPAVQQDRRFVASSPPAASAHSTTFASADGNNADSLPRAATEDGPDSQQEPPPATFGGLPVFIPAADTRKPLDERETTAERTATGVVATAELSAPDQAILKHYDERKLFTVKQYLPLRRIFAQRFAETHASEIRQAFGSQADELSAWLDRHEDLKGELYTAIDSDHDDVVSALSLFRELRNGFPDEIAAFGNLAIAVAVTWDRAETGVYDYADHQQRTKAEMPEARANALDSFAYLLQTDGCMQARGRFLPWEFLIHVVNHKTPMDERRWALANYLPHCSMIGRCYHDVPYDQEMLASGDRYTRLEGNPYTLPNLRTYGGVCAMQADYASRVAKSIGVPAAYVGGASRYGELHAWVMWVELAGVSQNSLAFTLQSHGRYDYDRYYVGHLQDPQTGATITDRQLELRLHTVGVNAIAKRHAGLLMRAYPIVREHRKLDLCDQVDYLNRVISICPGNEAAWIELSKLSQMLAGRFEYRKAMARTLDQVFVVFRRFPDFTWTIFDDLVAYEDDPAKRIQLYERLTALYVSAGRPDLASHATFKLCDLYEKQEQEVACIERLALTIKAFADEGAYVPPMLDRLEGVCKRVDGVDVHLQRFYLEFLPLIPQKRGDRPSKYCTSMYERAISFFEQRGRNDVAQMIGVQLLRVTKRF